MTSDRAWMPDAFARRRRRGRSLTLDNFQKNNAKFAKRIYFRSAEELERGCCSSCEQ
jgi:hypothetical protein